MIWMPPQLHRDYILGTSGTYWSSKAKIVLWGFLFFFAKNRMFGNTSFQLRHCYNKLDQKVKRETSKILESVTLWQWKLQSVCADAHRKQSLFCTSRECSLVILHWRIPSASIVPCSFLVWTLGRSGLRSHCLATSLITCRINDFQY